MLILRTGRITQREGELDVGQNAQVNLNVSRLKAITLSRSALQKLLCFLFSFGKVSSVTFSVFFF